MPKTFERTWCFSDTTQASRQIWFTIWFIPFPIDVAAYPCLGHHAYSTSLVHVKSPCDKRLHKAQKNRCNSHHLNSRHSREQIKGTWVRTVTKHPRNKSVSLLVESEKCISLTIITDSVHPLFYQNKVFLTPDTASGKKLLWITPPMCYCSCRSERRCDKHLLRTVPAAGMAEMVPGAAHAGPGAGEITSHGKTGSVAIQWQQWPNNGHGKRGSLW